MTLMPETYEPPPAGKGSTKKFAPAIEEARANPGRWVLVTTMGSVSSAASRTSGVRKDIERMGLEIARDENKILIRLPIEGAADDAPHWPEAEEAPAAVEDPAPHLGLPS